MRQTTRRTALAGTTAGLSLALLVPLAGPAAAHDSGREGRHSDGDRQSSWWDGRQSSGQDGRHSYDRGHHGTGMSWHHRDDADKVARTALREALWEARGELKAALRDAHTAFRSDPAVADARAELMSVLTTATDPAAILAAREAYEAAIAGPMATRDEAVELAWTTYWTAYDAAYEAHDSAVLSPEEAAARADYRAALRDARTTYHAERKVAYQEFRDATASAYATVRASSNAAWAAYEASEQTWDDRVALKTALKDARTAFADDPVVDEAKDALRSALSDAKDAYRTAVQDARDAYYEATGEYPTFDRGTWKHGKHGDHGSYRWDRTHGWHHWDGARDTSKVRV